MSLTRIAHLKRFQDPVQEVPVADPMAFHLWRQDSPEPRRSSLEGTVLPPYAHGEQKRTAEDRRENPGPGWERVVGTYIGEAPDCTHSERRRRHDEEELEEERHARWQQPLASHDEEGSRCKGGDRGGCTRKLKLRNSLRSVIAGDDVSLNRPAGVRRSVI